MCLQEEAVAIALRDSRCRRSALDKIDEMTHNPLRLYGARTAAYLDADAYLGVARAIVISGPANSVSPIVSTLVRVIR